MSKIIRNAIKFQDGTILESRHRHDFRTYAGLSVDGGLDYLRRVGKATMSVEDISLYTDSPFEDVREGLTWGTRGIKGDQPLRYIKLKDMETDHIKAVLRTQPHVYSQIREVMYRELEYRNAYSYEGEKVDMEKDYKQMKEIYEIKELDYIQNLLLRSNK